MITYILAILLAFSTTMAIAIPFINLLFKFNIRRTPKSELDVLLPGRVIKLGTPIMGGGMMIITLLIWVTIFLYSWEYYWMIVLILVFGALWGFIDEYLNTLGRTFKALRFTGSNSDKSLFPVSGSLQKVKNLLLKPWRVFEESIRAMGSEQRGMKPHWKFLMQISMGIIVAIFLVINQNGTYFYLPLIGDVNLWYFYYLFLIIYLVGFINAFGITDGMDGLSAGTHSLAFGMFGILAAYLGYTEVAILSFLVLGTELAFLYFNIQPARVEMSDVGTVPIGALFAVIPLLIHKELAVFFIGLIFIIEFFSSFLQVWSVKLRGKRILKIAPIHHHFEKIGWSENKVVMRFWLFACITGIFGLLIGLL